VIVDYGFYNCETLKEKLDLRKALLAQADPLELHQACMQGQIFEFAKSHITLETRFKRLMKNIYPLVES
jgi:hypothetical protein